MGGLKTMAVAERKGRIPPQAPRRSHPWTSTRRRSLWNLFVCAGRLRVLFTGLRRSAFIFLPAICTACTAPAPRPPAAAVDPRVSTVHGQERIDDYHWLRERDNPETIAYLEAENRFTEAAMKHTQRLQDRLYAEMRGRIKETDLTVPVRDGDYFYYRRTVEGLQYPIHCRKHDSLDAEEEIILDENRLAEGHEYFRVGVMRASPDHTLLAYSIDTTGAEQYTIHIKDLTTGGLLLDEIPNTAPSAEWGNDNRTLFYTTLDAAKRPHRVYRHVLGSDPAQADLIHQEDDERFRVWLTRTRSDRFVLLNVRSQITAEVHVLDADRPDGAFRMIHPRQQGMEYAVEHHGDHFYIRTNDEAVNFRLVRAPVNTPQKDNWAEVIPHREHVMLDGVDAFAKHLTVYERKNGLRTLRIINLAGGEEHYVEFPEPVYTFFAHDNREFHTNKLRFTYTSLVTPRSVFDYDMDARTRELLKQDEVLGGYDPAEYESRRLFAVAPDGVRVPISIVFRKGLVRNGRNPTLLDGYGSYGANREPFFSSDRISLLDRGFIYALAHIRGGGEMGRQWYENGKLLNKRNTFTDFIACAEHLIEKGYTSPDHLVITGGSAGGLLMGAVVNMRPDLFAAAVARVPFVDVVNTMLDASIPLTVIEYEEWGNPNEKEYYDYMMSYSPYQPVVKRGADGAFWVRRRGGRRRQRIGVAARSSTELSAPEP